MASVDALARVDRLNRASAKRVIEPDRDLPGNVGDGQLLPDDLLAGHWLWTRLDRLAMGWVIRHPAALHVMVIAGEEIPDLLQKLASEHPDTDPFLAEVNRYHRQEEARHLAYARGRLPEVWARAGRVERWVVRHVLPHGIRQLYQFLVHPGVYEEIGLDGWATWKAVHRSDRAVAVRHQATAPILDAVIDAGIISRRRVPKAWRDLVGRAV